MTLWLAAEPLVLASSSRVRREMLQAAGIPVEVHPADIDERAIEAAAGEAAPGEVAALLAHAKASAVSRQMPGRLVVGADQTLALGTRRFTKPADRDSATAQLKSLRRRSHQLSSAVAVDRDGVNLFRFVSVATLTMRDFSDDFVDRYVEETGPAIMESVGGYQLERTGVHLFEKIEGDHFTILGLPLLPLLAFLRQEGSVA